MREDRENRGWRECERGQGKEGVLGWTGGCVKGLKKGCWRWRHTNVSLVIIDVT